MRRERSDAAVAMLETKMELVRLQKQLMQPVLMMPNGQMDAAMAEEHMERGGNITRALHTLTTRMLEAQDRWEEKKAAIESSRSNDFAQVLQSLKSVVAASMGGSTSAHGAAGAGGGAAGTKHAFGGASAVGGGDGGGARLQRSEFLNRQTSVITRQLNQHKYPTAAGAVASSDLARDIPGRAGGEHTARAPGTAGAHHPPNMGLQNVFWPAPPGDRRGAAHGGRAARQAEVKRVRLGAGDSISFSTPYPSPFPEGTVAGPGGRAALKPDLVSETAAMLAAGELPIKAAPLVAVSKMSGNGHEHLLLPVAGDDRSAVAGAEFRRTFTDRP